MDAFEKTMCRDDLCLKKKHKAKTPNKKSDLQQVAASMWLTL